MTSQGPEPSPDADDRRVIGPLLRGVTWLEVLILAWAGPGLLLWPPVVLPVWPWALTPFNARFLGALYTAALLAAWIQARSGRWSPSRVITVMIFTFTAIVTVFSYVHADRFDPARIETWVWFGLYLGVCLNAGIHLGRYRTWTPPRDPGPPPARVRVVLAAIAACGSLYGVALLVLPGSAGAPWPWPIDAFHAQIYSTTFLTPAVGAVMLWRGSTPADRHALGFTLTGWGGLPVLGLMLADRATGRMPWSAGTTWAWIAGFLAFGALGLLLACASGSGRNGRGHHHLDSPARAG